jgi:hypothetical protein
MRKLDDELIVISYGAIVAFEFVAAHAPLQNGCSNFQTTRAAQLHGGGAVP